MPAVPRRRRKQFYVRRKVCRFCVDSKLLIDFKDVATLRQFVTERGKIIPRRISGNCWVVSILSTASRSPPSSPTTGC